MFGVGSHQTGCQYVFLVVGSGYRNERESVY